MPLLIILALAVAVNTLLIAVYMVAKITYLLAKDFIYYIKRN